MVKPILYEGTIALGTSMDFKLYPQNGERIVTIDSVKSIHPMYTPRGTADPSRTTYWNRRAFCLRSEYSNVSAVSPHSGLTSVVQPE